MAEADFALVDWMWRFDVGSYALDDAVFSDSPVSIVSLEHWRRRAAELAELGPGVPTRRFLFGAGEPPERHYTKVGGLPYRPAGLQWPTDVTGRPMSFLAQINFQGTEDIVGQLPGTVLLIFIRVMRSYLVSVLTGVMDQAYDARCIAFEWHQLGIDKLCEESDLPGPYVFPREEFQVISDEEPLTGQLVIPNCYGVGCRSNDYLEMDRLSELFAEIVPLELLPRNDFLRAATLRGLAIQPRTKIGGLPFWYGEPQDITGRFIGSFWGVGTVTDSPFPWVNRAAPEPLRGSTDDDKYLSLGERGMNLYLRDDGEVDWFKEMP
jgi:hypothetical protein